MVAIRIVSTPVPTSGVGIHLPIFVVPTIQFMERGKALPLQAWTGP
jgi:hypothetical protein